MPWSNDRASREHTSATYGADWRRVRDTVRKNARGICAGCSHRHGSLECDHVIPVSQGGTHALPNLRMLCKGPGTCKCHEAKTAAEGGARGRRKTRDPQPTSRIIFDPGADRPPF